MQRLAKLSLANRALIALITLTIAFFGAITLSGMKQELVPSISLPQVSVITTYPGASPEIVDKDVSSKVESALQGIQGLESTSTTSSAGSSIVLAEFAYGTDLVYAEQRMQQAINRIDGQLPDDAEWDVLSGSIDDFPVVQLAVTGGDPAENAKRIREQLTGDLRDLDGVRGVDLFGDRTERITIKPRIADLAAKGVSMQDIRDTLDNAGVLIPAGQMTEGDETFTVQAGQVIDSADELGELPITAGGQGSSGQSSSQSSESGQGSGSDAEGGTGAQGSAGGSGAGTGSADAQQAPAPAAPAGEVVTISEVADVKQDLAPESSFSRVNGKDALSISITKRPSANTVEVSQLVRDQIPHIKDVLGGDVDVIVAMDQAPFVTQSIDTLVQEGLLGLGFAVLIIFLFLFSFRATLITAISIPLSLLVTFIAMFFMNYSLNMLTLAALTIAIGRVVDDSIVVVENIRRHIELNPSAALRGSERVLVIRRAVGEVASAITASTLATVAVFLPVLFVGDVTGELFRPFALTNTIALLSSLVVSLTIVPVLSYWFLGRSKVKAKDAQDTEIAEPGRHAALDEPVDGGATASEIATDSENETGASTSTEREPVGVLANEADDTAAPTHGAHAGPQVEEDEPRNWLQRGYEPLLRGVLAKPLIVLIAAVVLLVGTGALAPLIQTNFLGNSGQTTFTLLQKGASNASFEAMTDRAKKVQDIVDKVDGIEVSQASYGSDPMLAMFASGTPMIRWSITTKPDADPDAIQQRLLDDIGKHPELGEVTTAQGGQFSSDVTVRVQAPDMAALKDAEAKVAPALKEVEGVSQVTSDLQDTRPFVRLDIDSKKAAERGLNDAIVAGQVAQALQPVPVGSVMINGSSLRIYFEGDAEPPKNIDELRNLEIQGGALPVKLSELGSVEMVEGPAQLTAESGTLYTDLTLKTDSGDLGGLSAKVEDKVAQLDLPAGVSAELGGSAADQRTAFTQLGFALLAAILIVYIVMVATLKSLLQPLLLMISVPFAATGAILMQVATGVPLGVASLIGVLMLIGVVVTNAIVLIDLVNQYRARGQSVREATFHGASRRVRPIIMTALATILALTPMALGITGHGGFISQPMAIVVIGGLLSSTVLTLIVLPALYSLVEGALARRKARREERVEQRIREAGLDGTREEPTSDERTSAEVAS